MQSGVKRVSKIVSGLKAFCRKEKGKPQPCSINECVEQALRLCHNTMKYHVTVLKDLNESIEQVNADAQQIEQVLVNLFLNATDATKGQGEGKVHVKTRNTASNVVITIEDDGPGIPSGTLEDIWQPFYTTKPVDKGTGLGLSISMGIIEEHDGTIKAENKPTGGALFTIELPALTQGDRNERKGIDS